MTLERVFVGGAGYEERGRIKKGGVFFLGRQSSCFNRLVGFFTFFLSFRLFFLGDF